MSRYDGPQPFAAYLVLRRATELTSVETLAVIEDADGTAFVDSLLAADTA